MTEYNKIGFKAGIEIHQQIETDKLFCNCPSYLRSDEPNFIIERKLHSVAGETGEIDVAVAHEAAKDKTFLYQGYHDTTCLIELDEEPPHFINEDALNETIKICLLLNCEIYPMTQIMRKTVIDGSNTSGFQRTILIAHDGFIETSFGKVTIQTVCLEEDAARIINKDEKQTIYRLDRLGIPLVEIATAPIINNPKQIKETALKIGEMLRVCKVKRGIGTIRQDINISIKGHERVEIKGFQDLAMMEITAEKEILRQQKEVSQGKTQGEVRNAQEDSSSIFLRPLPGSARMYPETDLPILKISRDKIISLKKALPKLKNEIREELQKKGLPEELLRLVLDRNLDEFEVLLRVHPKNPSLVAKMVTLWRAEFASKLGKRLEDIKESLNGKVLEEVLENVFSGKIDEKDVRDVLFKIASGTNLEEALNVKKITHDKLEKEIHKIMQEKPGLTVGAYMGLIIESLGSGINKKNAMDILKKIVK